MVIHSLIACGLCWGLLSWLLRTRLVNVFLDTPDRRKMHQRLVPRMGGFGVIVATLGVLLFAGLEPVEAALCAGAAVLLLLGLLDDSSLPYYLQRWNAQRRGDEIKEKWFLRVRYKLILEVGLVVGVVYALGLAPTSLTFVNVPVELGLLSFPLTCFWVLGVMNAFNLIDGIDGLCGGVAFLSLAAIAYLGYVLGQPDTQGAALAVAGAVMGFLFLNVSPARLFMGDMGSLFVGFAVAVLSLSLLEGGAGRVDGVSVLFLAGLPVLDVFVAIWRRFGDVPAGSSLKTRLKRIVGADSNHMHHRLLYLGLGHLRASLVLYALAGVLLAGAVLMVLAVPHWRPWIVLYLLFAIAVALANIYYRSQVENLRANLLNGLRGMNDRTWKVGVSCVSSEVRDALAAQRNLPFEFEFLGRDELHSAGLSAQIIEQLPGESTEELLAYAKKYACAAQATIALIVSDASIEASEVREHPHFVELGDSVAVYNRPLYVWPLLLKMLEQLRGSRSTGAQPVLKPAGEAL